jgi:RNA polymerase sigma-32 factor
LKASASSLESYLKQIRQFPILSQEEEFGLAVRYRKENDMSAARTLIESNLRFVVRVALEFRFYGIKVSDLIQEGNIGLIMALRKFDPYKGFRFVSYAIWWIRAYIQNFIMKNWSLVKIGTTQAERKLFYKIGKVRKALQTDREDANRYETLARDFDVAKEDIVEMEQRMTSRDYSLDTRSDDAEETTPYNLFESHSPDQEEILGREEERQILRKKIREWLRFSRWRGGWKDWRATAPCTQPVWSSRPSRSRNWCRSIRQTATKL